MQDLTVLSTNWKLISFFTDDMDKVEPLIRSNAISQFILTNENSIGIRDISIQNIDKQIVVRFVAYI